MQPAVNFMTPPQAVNATAWVGVQGGPPKLGGQEPTRFADSDAFLLSEAPYGYAAYVIEMRQSGVAGLDLVRLVRRRSTAPVLVLTTALDADFVPALAAGADMVLDADAPRAHLDAALSALARRAATARPMERDWQFRPSARRLLAPSGTDIALTDSDLVILTALANAPDHVVQRDDLMLLLWGRTDPALHNALHATVYRLRRRMEQDGGVSPLQALTGVGYVFKARLTLQA